MKLYYTEGPQFMTCGIAGQFKLGVPREVPDDLAAILLRKGRLKEFEENPPESAGPPASSAKRKGKEE